MTHEFDAWLYIVYTAKRGDLIMMTTIQKWGNSQGVRLPKFVLEELSLQENDPVEIITENDLIIIKKATRKRRAKKSLEERFENFFARSGDYQCAEYDWGRPVGKEVW